MGERKRLEKEIDSLRRELAANASGDLLDSVREIGGIQVLAAELPGDAGTLRDQADSLRSKMGSGVVVLGSRDQGSVLLVAAATKDVISQGVHAGNIIREVAKLVGGGAAAARIWPRLAERTRTRCLRPSSTSMRWWNRAD